MAYYVNVQSLSENQRKGLEAVLKAAGYNFKHSKPPKNTLDLYLKLNDSLNLVQYLGNYCRNSIYDYQSELSPRQLIEKLAPSWATGLGSTPFYHSFWWYNDDKMQNIQNTNGWCTEKGSIELLKAFTLFTFNKPKRPQVDAGDSSGETGVDGSTLARLRTLLRETFTAITVDNSEGECEITLDINDVYYQVESLEKAVAALEKYKAFLDSVEEL